MKIYKNIQPNNKFKIFTILLFFGLFFIANEVLALAYPYTPYTDDKASQNIWRENPYDCPIDIDGEAPNDGRVLCGFTGTAEWYFPFNLTTSSVSSTVSNYADTRSIPYNKLKKGGFVINCAAYDSSEPYCNNSGSYWCNADSSCQETLRVQTICNENKWASDDPSSAFTCVTPGAAPSTTGCISGYANCSSTAPGCETRIGVTSCTGAGGLQGTLNASCDCIVPASNFRTGIQAEFLTSSPLLWGKQYGDGDLIRFTNNAVATSSFVVFNSGQVAIGHNINVSTTSVAFEVSSTQRGILIPRLGGTNPITNGVDGELYYNTTSKKFMYYNGLAWGELGSGGSSWVTTTLLSVSGNATGLYPVGTVSTTIGIGSTGADLWLQTSSTPRIYVAENGNVGIGTVTPTEKLSVVGNISNLITSQSGIRKISSVNVGAFSSDIHVSGKYAYVTNKNSNSISIVDISNPSTPIQISTASVGSRPSAIYVSNKYAYVTNQDSNSISVVDISNPSVPVQISATSVESYPNDIHVSGKYAYVINQNSSSISVVDISNPYSPIQISTTSVGYNPRSIYISGKYAYIIKNEASANISVVDISNPYLPTQIYSGDIDPYPESIYVSGNYAYTVNAFGSISIININNPYLPVQISTTSVGTSPVSVYVSGKYAYVTNYASDFVSVVDISSPSSPIQVSTTSVGYNMRAIYVSGRYAYATHYNAVGSVSVIDLTGTEVSSLIAHSAEVGNLQIGNDLSAKGTADFGSLSIGIGGIISNGPISVMATNSPSYFGGNVGIGTTSPSFKLTLGEDGGIYSAWPNYSPQTSLSGTVLPSTSSGTLMFWYPRKAAFRAGVIDKSQPNGNAWDETNIGPLSFSFGGNNVASATGTFVVGGANTSSGQYSSITGGTFNNITGNVSFIGGGFTNTISSGNSAIGGGSYNTISGAYSFIGAGRDNVASGYASFVGGGRNNTSSGQYSASFGYGNEVSGNYSFVSGQMNEVSGYNSVAFGNKMNVSGNYSFGINLEPDDEGSVVNLSNDRVLAVMGGNVGIGTTNPLTKLHIAGDGSILATGTLNSGFGWDGGNLGAGTRMMWISEKGAFRAGYVNGTEWNSINIGVYSAVFGRNNTALGSASFVGGGNYNKSTGGNSFVGGGYDNTAEGGSSFIGSGDYNIASSTGSFVGAGYRNKSAGQYSFIGGGYYNEVKNLNSFVGSGAYNLASGTYSFAGGGQYSYALGDNSFVGGGQYNNASGDNAFVGGGYSNVASGTYSFVGGGYDNVAGGSYSSAFGRNATVNGSYSMGINLASTAFTLNNANTMAIMGGKVGIGTVAPVASLHLAGDGSILATGTLNSGWDGGTLGAGTRLMWIPEKAAFRAGYVGGTQWNSSNIGDYSTAFGYSSIASGINSTVFGRNMTVSGARSFGISLAESSSYTVSEDNVMAIMGGDVGIGVASPDAKLHVITSGGDYAAILTGGYVGINTSTPSYQLDVWKNTNGNTVRISDPDGVCLLNPSASGWSCSSDERLKREILNINKGLQEILAIRPVNYYWKNNPEDNLYKTGFIAQELKEVIPEAVFLEEQTGYFTVNETVLIPILVKAVQEQQAEIEALREAVSTTLSIQQSGGQLTYSGGDLDLQNYALLNVKNIVSIDNKWAIDENGQFITRIQTSDGNTKEMFAMQSPYSEFVFSSSSELINGEAIINFDPDTCELIDETQPLKVNITLTGECSGIFVKEKTATGFTVKELNGGTSTSTFDWMVIAKRKFATTSPQSLPTGQAGSPSQGEEGVPSPLEGEGQDEVEIPSTLEGEGEVVTTTPPAEAEPLTEQISGDGEPTTTPEVLPEPPIEEPPVEAEPLTEQSSGDGEPTPPAEENP